VKLAVRARVRLVSLSKRNEMALRALVRDVVVLEVEGVDR
jgi:hypothetical protein